MKHSSFEWISCTLKFYRSIHFVNDLNLVVWEMCVLALLNCIYCYLRWLKSTAYLLTKPLDPVHTISRPALLWSPARLQMVFLL